LEGEQPNSIYIYIYIYNFFIDLPHIHGITPWFFSKVDTRLALFCAMQPDLGCGVLSIASRLDGTKSTLSWFSGKKGAPHVRAMIVEGKVDKNPTFLEVFSNTTTFESHHLP